MTKNNRGIQNDIQFRIQQIFNNTHKKLPYALIPMKGSMNEETVK